MKPINGINPNMLKKLSIEDVRQMREMRLEGIEPQILARTFNIHITTVKWHTDLFAPEIDLEDYPHRKLF